MSLDDDLARYFANGEPDSKRPRVTLKKASDSRAVLQPPPKPDRQQNGRSGARSEQVWPTTVGDSQPVTFDVGGQLFKVPSKLISSRPGTLLAQLLESRQKTDDNPIFVDSDPSRFRFMLDWYRYEEIHVPSSISIEAVLADARRHKLPEQIFINGVMRSRLKSAGHEAANNLLTTVIDKWRGFPAYLTLTLDKIWQHYKSVGGNASAGLPEDEAYDFTPFRLPLYAEDGWVDQQNVCSAARARVLAVKIEARGYLCSFSDTELVVTLPLKLQGECSQQAPLDDFGDEEEVAEGALSRAGAGNGAR